MTKYQYKIDEKEEKQKILVKINADNQNVQTLHESMSMECESNFQLANHSQIPLQIYLIVKDKMGNCFYPLFAFNFQIIAMLLHYERGKNLSTCVSLINIYSLVMYISSILVLASGISSYLWANISADSTRSFLKSLKVIQKSLQIKRDSVQRFCVVALIMAIYLEQSREKHFSACRLITKTKWCLTCIP